MSENDEKTVKTIQKAPKKASKTRKKSAKSTDRMSKKDKSRAKMVEICGPWIKGFEESFKDRVQEVAERRLGRPTKYEKDISPLAVEALMADGFSFEASCGAMGICKDTGYEWVKKHPDFSDAKKRGEVLSQIWWEQNGKKGMFWGSKDFNATIWVFAMKNRFNWKDNRDLNLGGQAGNPISATGPIGAILDEIGDLDEDDLDAEIEKIRIKARNG